MSIRLTTARGAAPQGARPTASRSGCGPSTRPARLCSSRTRTRRTASARRGDNRSTRQAGVARTSFAWTGTSGRTSTGSLGVCETCCSTRPPARPSPARAAGPVRPAHCQRRLLLSSGSWRSVASRLRGAVVCCRPRHDGSRQPQRHGGARQERAAVAPPPSCRHNMMFRHRSDSCRFPARQISIGLNESRSHFGAWARLSHTQFGRTGGFCDRGGGNLWQFEMADCVNRFSSPGTCRF